MKDRVTTDKTLRLLELKTTTMGSSVSLKHLRDRALYLDRKLGERAKRIFERELLAWSNGLAKLITACLIHAKQAHC
ncbi:MAG TPA: hypothetical protein VGA51_12865 [Casimicrobiaceae bacterium]